MTTRVLAVHGGVAGRRRPRPPRLDRALRAGHAANTAVDAVETAVRVLEDDPILNAGYGAVVTRDGSIELDAGIADGSTGAFGGVACVRVRHPVSLARRVMERTPHVLLVAEGAMRLAQDLEVLDETTPEQLERWRRGLDAAGILGADYGRSEDIDTVGAVALDAEGRLAAATSTGGVFGQLPGRVGDSPIFGAGLYASREAAVVATGLGESLFRIHASLRTGMLIGQGVAPQEAVEEVLSLLVRASPAPAGILAIDSKGRLGAAFVGEEWPVLSEPPLAPVRLEP